MNSSSPDEGYIRNAFQPAVMKFARVPWGKVALPHMLYSTAKSDSSRGDITSLDCLRFMAVSGHQRVKL
jgi:hypothetical protein